MKKLKVLVTIPKGTMVFDTFIPQSVIERLEEIAEVEYNETGRQFTPDELKEKLMDKDVALTGWSTPAFDEYILKDNKSLKMLAHTGGTVQTVASDYVYERGIKVISGNDIYAESVAESVIAYALTVLRDIPYYDAQVKSGGWKGEKGYSEGLLDQKIGLVGYGMTVKHLIKMLKPFRPELLVYSSHISDDDLKTHNMKKASLEEIFSSCKIISLHSAMTEKNYHMITRELMEMIRPDAVMINTARGGIIDEEAMTDLLEQDRFRVVLDVYEQEPLPEDHRLRKIKNSYFIPHMAGPTVDRRKYVTLGLIDDILNFFEGNPLRLEITQTYKKYMTK